MCKRKFPTLEGEELDNVVFPKVHNTLVAGFDKVKEELFNYLKESWTEEDEELSDEAVNKKMKKELFGQSEVYL